MSQKEASISFIFILFCLFSGPYTIVLRGYSWLYVQKLLLARLGDHIECRDWTRVARMQSTNHTCCVFDLGPEFIFNLFGPYKLCQGLFLAMSSNLPPSRTQMVLGMEIGFLYAWQAPDLLYYSNYSTINTLCK